MTPLSIPSLKKLRRQLHQYPELSGREKQTPSLILNFLKATPPDRIIKELGQTGLALVYDSGKSGPCVMFRCELDALPIREINNFEHRSAHAGVAHLCGHDGHMAIITGLAALFGRERPQKGKVVLLYQPAEETGEGALQVIKDLRFQEIKPNYLFALHNIPHYPAGQVIVKNDIFAAASQGMTVKLKGATAHAGQPQNGRSPALAMAEIIKAFTLLPESEKSFKSFTLVTVVHALLGEIAFGTTPGYAEVRATLRTYLDDDMEKLSAAAEEIVKKLARDDQLAYEINYSEIFPAVYNDKNAVDMIREAAGKNNFELKESDTPFRWSEDFSQFSQRYPSALFGLGAGMNVPDLHNADYDFPDEIIETGLKLFFDIAKNILDE